MCLDKYSMRLQPSPVPIPRTKQANVELVRCTRCLKTATLVIAFTWVNNQKTHNIAKNTNSIYTVKDKKNPQ